jgi:hypothetical protein
MRTKRTQNALRAQFGDFGFHLVNLEAIFSKRISLILSLGFALSICGSVMAETPPPTSCGSPISFTLSNITTEGCDLNFLPSDTTVNISYDFEIQPRDSAQGSASLILSGNTGDIDSVFTIAGLNAATFYSVYVRAICETNITSEWIEPLDLYTLPSCASTWYDSGGPDGDAQMNANEVFSICPDTTSQVVSVIFTSFDVEENWDVLYIYDGPDTSYPKLFSNTGYTSGGFPSGGISGTDLPNDGFPIYSNHNSGCLTFKFLSDADVSSPGWSAQLNCQNESFCGSIYGTEVISVTGHEASLDAIASIHGEIQSIIWEAQPKGVALGSSGGITGISDSIPILINGLAESTEYSVYFQVVCTSGDSSTWSVGPDFSTTPDCATAIDIQFGQVYSVNLDGWGSWNQGYSGTGVGPFNTLGQERLFRLEILYTGLYAFEGLGGNGWVDYFWKDADTFLDCNEQNWNYMNDIYSSEYFTVILNAGTYYILLDAESPQPLTQNFSISYLFTPPGPGDVCGLAIQMGCPISSEHQCMTSGQQWFYYEAEFDSECVVATDYDDVMLNYFGQTISIYDGSCDSNILIAQSVQSPDSAFDVLTTFSALAGHNYLIKASNTIFGPQHCFTISFYCSDACLDSTACNYNPEAINGIGYCFYDDECNGCTNPNANNYNYFATIDDETCVFGLQAKVFCDSNMDGIYSSPELAAYDIGVYFSELDTVLFTNANGIIELDLPQGIYNLQLQLDSSIGTSTPRNLIFDISDQQLVYFGINSGCTIGCTDSTACNFDPMALYDNENCLFGSDCEDCIDELADNYNPYATIDNGSCIYSGHVKVFCDLNGNGIYSSYEPGMPNRGVYFPDLDMTVFTDNYGNIDLILSPGEYLVQLIADSNFMSTTPISATMIVPSATPTYFGIVPIGGVNGSLNVSQNIQGPFSCNFGYYTGACIYYFGSSPIHGTLSMTFNEMFIPEPFYGGVAPTIIGMGAAQWNIAAFSNSVYPPRVHFDGPGPQFAGQSFDFDFHLVLYNSLNQLIYDHYWTNSPVITCAYDPNLIEVDPIGYDVPHYVASGEHLQYKVQFQNTGNAPASEIHVEDFLDPLIFDLSTFAPVVSSHNMNACLHGNGSVDFIFNNINLPDSASNEQGSHGFLIYNVNLLDALDHNLVASNYADIYFEENPAVTTNTVFNTVFDCSSIAGIIGPDSFCENDEVEFIAGQDFIESYSWQLDGVIYSTGSTLNTNLLPSGIENLEVILINPICEEIRSFAVDVHPLPNLTELSDQSVCEGESLLLNAESDESVSWSNGIENGTSFIPEYNQQLIATSVSSFGCTTSDSIWIEIVALPTTDVVQSGYELTAPEGCCWQWYLNNVAIDGLTGQSITAMAEGVYYVVTTNDEGCGSTSESIVVIGIGEDEVSSLSVYPNPLKTSATILLPEGIFDLRLYDATGKLVKNYGKNQVQFILERGDFPAGNYHLSIESDARIMSLQLIIE